MGRVQKPCDGVPKLGMIVGAFVFSHTGAAPKRRKCLAWRSDRDLRAGQMDARVPWELVRSVSLLSRKSQKQKGGTGQTTPWRTSKRPSGSGERKSGQRKVLRRESNERRETESGSLSGFIVATESRRTDLREPVSSEGGRQNTEPSLETRDEHRVIAKRVTETVADSSTGANPYF